MKFVHGRQRAKVMGILKREGYRYKPLKITDEGKFIHVRVRQPSEFKKSSFRTIDTGRLGYTKLRIGRPKGETRTATQSILLNKRDFGFGE